MLGWIFTLIFFIYNLCDTFIVSWRNTIAETGRLETYCTDHINYNNNCFFGDWQYKVVWKRAAWIFCLASYFLLYRVKKIIKTNMTLGWADENICLNYSFKTLRLFSIQITDSSRTKVCHNKIPLWRQQHESTQITTFFYFFCCKWREHCKQTDFTKRGASAKITTDVTWSLRK